VVTAGVFRQETDGALTAALDSRRPPPALRPRWGSRRHGPLLDERVVVDRAGRRDHDALAGDSAASDRDDQLVARSQRRSLGRDDHRPAERMGSETALPSTSKTRSGIVFVQRDLLQHNFRSSMSWPKPGASSCR